MTARSALFTDLPSAMIARISTPARRYYSGRSESSPQVIRLSSQDFNSRSSTIAHWHLENRNPAFIPWHTQAYYIVWELTGEGEFADAVFAMNDWLLGVQQWESAPHPDCQGRFYDPIRPFGPPHASSTAVYLEGLADAFALGRAVGEHDRADTYRTAILRGLRSLSQLTFKDDVDMFYISKRKAVRGGVQTSEYDNAVRVDNVQHALTAIDKIPETLAPPPGIIVAWRGGVSSSSPRGRSFGRRETCPARSGR